MADRPFYELWTIATADLVDSFESLDDARKFFEYVLIEFGPEAFADWSFGGCASDPAFGVKAGAELLAWVTEERR